MTAFLDHPGLNNVLNNGCLDRNITIQFCINDITVFQFFFNSILIFKKFNKAYWR